jgi:hypothetical protein
VARSAGGSTDAAAGSSWTFDHVALKTTFSFLPSIRTMRFLRLSAE